MDGLPHAIIIASLILAAALIAYGPLVAGHLWLRTVLRVTRTGHKPCGFWRLLAGERNPKA